VIESTAIQIGACSVDDSAYVGHYAIIGAPQVARGFGEAGAQAQREPSRHWLPSSGATIAEAVTIASHVVIGDGTTIGPRAFIGERAYVGHNVVIGADVELCFGAQIHDRVVVGAGAWVGGFVCNDVHIGAQAIVFGSLVHRFVDAVRGIPEDPPSVGPGAFIGMGAMVIGGIHVGESAYVAAGSVLTITAKDGRLYAGNPARDRGAAPLAFKDAAGRCGPARQSACQDVDVPDGQ
jgi:UDP-2-acetamido-3-amino-2,3-dideoxy-glucuronate N-acetyltransferase